MKRALIFLLALALGVTACEPYEPPQNEFEKKADAPVSAGSLNVTKYVALGNSLTAGFADNALYLESQQVSYPAIIAQQMVPAGAPATFNQLLMPAGIGFGGFAAAPAPQPPSQFSIVLGQQFARVVPTTPPVGSSTLTVLQDTASAYRTHSPLSPTWRPATGQATNQNFGVPGVTIQQSLAGALGNPVGGNPFYLRIASNPGTSTLVGDAAAAAPTVWTMWLGNNDILGYATSGGVAPATTVASFRPAFDAALTQMVAVANSRGVVANIPDVTSIAFFRAVGSTSFPPAPGPPFSTSTAAASNALWQAYLVQLAADASVVGGLPAGVVMGQPFVNPVFNAGEPRRTGVVFVTGTGGIRQSNATDLLALTAQLGIPQPGGVSRGLTPPLTVVPTGGPNIFASLSATAQAICNGVSGGANVAFLVPNAGPLGSQFVLDQAEIAFARQRTTELNAEIAASVTANGMGRVALWDANAFFTTVATSGIRVGDSRGGSLMRVDYLTGGLFSLDGVHPTPAGAAIIANQFLRTMNTAFGSTFKEVDPTTYRAVNRR